MPRCHTFTCGVFRPGQPFDRDRDCPDCWAAAHNPTVAAALGRGPVVPVVKGDKPKPFPCVHRGGPTGERLACTEGCRPGVLIPLQSCSQFGRCTVGIKTAEDVPVCRDCRRREVPAPPVADPEPAGPGTELRNLLKAAGIDLAGCSCNKRVRVMNAMGAEWCRERRDVIVGWLREVADRDGWPKINLPAILDAALGSSP